MIIFYVCIQLILAHKVTRDWPFNKSKYYNVDILTLTNPK